MYCRECGAEINSSDNVCEKCGVVSLNAANKKSAAKKINIACIATLICLIAALIFSISGLCKAKERESYWEEQAELGALYDYNHEGADHALSAKRFRVDFAARGIRYEQCLIFTGISIAVLIIYNRVWCVVYKKKVL